MLSSPRTSRSTDDGSDGNQPLLTPSLALALVATIMGVISVFILGMDSQAENRPPEEAGHALPQFLIAGSATVCAWLAHIWMKQAHRRHSAIAGLLALALVIAWSVYISLAAS